MKENYNDAISALVKAYKLGDFEVLESVRNQIYRDFGNTIGDNIEAMAHSKIRRH